MDARGAEVVIEMTGTSTHLLPKTARVSYNSFQGPLLFRTALQTENYSTAINSLEDKISSAGTWVREKENYLGDLSKIHHDLYYSAGTTTAVEIIIISLLIDTNDNIDGNAALLYCASLLACMMTLFFQLYGNINTRNNYTVTYWEYLDEWNKQLDKPVSTMTVDSLNQAIRNVHEAFKEADSIFRDSFIFNFLSSLITTFLQTMLAVSDFPGSKPVKICIATVAGINSLATAATLIHGLFKHYQHHPQRKQDNDVLAVPSGQINYSSLAKKV